MRIFPAKAIIPTTTSEGSDKSIASLIVGLIGLKTYILPKYSVPLSSVEKLVSAERLEVKLVVFIPELLINGCNLWAKEKQDEKLFTVSQF